MKEQTGIVIKVLCMILILCLVLWLNPVTFWQKLATLIFIISMYYGITVDVEGDFYPREW